jgi:hypothetical protein
VASSTNTIFFFSKTALTTHNNYFSPPDISFSSKVSVNDILNRFSHLMVINSYLSSSIVFLPEGSRLLAKEPSNKKASYEMYV